MWKLLTAACATLALSVGAAHAGPRMCKATVEVPCPEVAPAPKVVQPTKRITPYPVPHAAAPPAPHADMVCVKMCVDDEHWRLCKSKPPSWYANMKGHPNAKPHNDQATPFSTARFFTQCGIDCRPRGTMRFGHQSEYTKKWTVFRFGHPSD